MRIPTTSSWRSRAAWTNGCGWSKRISTPKGDPTVPRSSVREELLSAGLETLHRRGFNATSVQDITDAAGAPKGSFYNHFESKEALAAEAVRRYREKGQGAPEHPAGRETAAAATAPKILRKSQPGRHRGWVLGRVPAGKFRGRAVHSELTRSRTRPRGVCRMVRCDCRPDRRGAEGWCHLRDLLAQGVGGVRRPRLGRGHGAGQGGKGQGAAGSVPQGHLLEDPGLSFFRIL